MCQATRTELASPPAGITAPLPAVVIAFQLTIQPPTRCGSACADAGDINCTTQAALVWQDELDAAEEFYDRTDACAFTTFPAYEWTNNLNGFNLHRNIIFRNAEVPALPTSYYEQPLVEGLFMTLENECLGAPGNCDFVSIPHNSNASGGLMFEPANGNGSPLTKADAERRAAHETLVEIFQHKGSSECQPATSPNDELCGFEQLQAPAAVRERESHRRRPRRSNFVRNALEEGLRQNDLLGANPFKLGFIGSTDGHSSLAGGVVEADFGTTGHLGVRDGSAENILSRIGPGRHRHQRRRPRRAVGRGELARLAVRGDAPSRGVCDQRHAADRALLRRPSAQGRCATSPTSSRRATRAASRWAATSDPCSGGGARASPSWRCRIPAAAASRARHSSASRS